MSLGLSDHKKDDRQERLLAIRKALGPRSVVLIGLMGAGKTAVGRRLANRLDLPFIDADSEIEVAAGASISEIFAEHGEAYFRQGERKVIARLLENGPQVLATGGGAYMNPDTRANIKAHGLSVWLKADIKVLMKRVGRRDNRPLLAAGDPEKVMKRLMEERYPIYAEADVTVESRDVPHDVIVGAVIDALADKLGYKAKCGQRGPQEGEMMRDGATALAGGQSETIIDVKLPGRSYPIVIGDGLIASAGRRIAAALPGARCAVVSDRNVAALYLGALKASLDREGLFLGEAVVSPGEASKSFPVLAPLCESLLELGVERGDCVIALGGGVVGDLAGFAASILRRGVRVVQMPDLAVGPGRFLGRRQDRHRHAARQEFDRHLPSTEPGARRHRHALDLEPARVPRGLCRGGEIRAASAMRRSSPGSSRIGREVFASPGDKRRHAVETSVRAKAADRGGRRARGERHARSAQSRPYFRPCARSLRRLFGSALARRGDRHRHAPCLHLLGRARALPGRRRRPRRAASRSRRAAGQDLGNSRRHAQA